MIIAGGFLSWARGEGGANTILAELYVGGGTIYSLNVISSARDIIVRTLKLGGI